MTQKGPRVGMMGQKRNRCAPRLSAATRPVIEPLERRAMLTVVTEFDQIVYFYGGGPNFTEIAPAPDGSIWFVQPALDKIAHATRDGKIATFQVPHEHPSTVYDRVGADVALGGDGNIYFVRHDAGWQIARFTPEGQFSEVFAFQPEMIGEVEAGPDGSIWFTQGDTRIGHLGLDGQIAYFNVDVRGSLTGLALSSDGTLWFTGYNHIVWKPIESGELPAFSLFSNCDDILDVDFSASAVEGLTTEYSVVKSWPRNTSFVGTIAPDGTITQFATNSSQSVFELAPGPEGRMYLATSSAIGEVTPQGNVSWKSLGKMTVRDVAADASGMLWVLDASNAMNSLGRLTPDGLYSRWRAPIESHAIGAGQDGRLWFLDAYGEKSATLGLKQGFLTATDRINVEHKKPFTKKLASFLDLSGASRPESFAASIDWGGGKTSQGTIVANAAGGFDVMGSSSLTWGWHTVTVTITDKRVGPEGTTPAPVLTLRVPAYATAPAIAGKGIAITPQAGRFFQGAVATYAGLDHALLDRFSARIQWGDGETSSAVLRPTEMDIVQVIGTHTYDKPGSYDIVVYVDQVPNPQETNRINSIDNPIGDPIDNPIGDLIAPIGYPETAYAPPSFNDARTRAVVAEGSVDGFVLSVQPTYGLPYTEPIARFQVADAADDLSHYRAKVRWGGDDAPEVEAQIQPDGSGAFYVVASHVLVEYERVTVTIYDDRLDPVTGTVAVARGRIWGRSPLLVTTVPFTATEGIPFRGTVGQITSPGSGTLWSSAFEVTIDWGDGLSSPGTIVPTGDGTYEVIGEHTYELLGYGRSYSGRIRVREVRQPLDSSLPPGQRTYSESSWGWLPLGRVLPGIIDGFRLSGRSSNLNVGKRYQVWLGSIYVGNATVGADEFTGQVVWENGDVSELQVTNWGDGKLGVSGDCGFASVGTYVGTLTVTGRGVTHSVQVASYVVEPPPPPVQPIGQINAQHIWAVHDVEFSGPVGRFWPTDPSIPIEQFQVRIGWGDGRSSDGTLTPDSDGWFIVSGTHRYTSPSDYLHLSMEVSMGDRSVYAWARAHVSRNPDRIYAEGRSLNFRQREPFTTKVATFFPLRPDIEIEQYQATIEWGDGKTSAGQITRGYAGELEVSGTHTYAISGYRTVRVTITGPGGPASATSSIWLDRDPVVVTPTRPTVNQLQVSGRVATFIDEDGRSTNPDVYYISHAGLMDWGDGLVSVGTITENPDGTFAVDAAHTFAEPGEYTVTLVVRRNTYILPGMESYVRFDTNGGTNATLAASCSSDDDDRIRVNLSTFEYSAFLFKLRVSADGQAKVVLPPPPVEDPAPEVLPPPPPPIEETILPAPPPIEETILPDPPPITAKRPAVRKPARPSKPSHRSPAPKPAPQRKPARPARKPSPFNASGQVKFKNHLDWLLTRHWRESTSLDRNMRQWFRGG